MLPTLAHWTMYDPPRYHLVLDVGYVMLMLEGAYTMLKEDVESVAASWTGEYLEAVISMR